MCCGTCERHRRSAEARAQTLKRADGPASEPTIEEREVRDRSQAAKATARREALRAAGDRNDGSGNSARGDVLAQALRFAHSFLDARFYDVADRHNARQAVILDDGDVTESSARHLFHQVFD